MERLRSAGEAKEGLSEESVARARAIAMLLTGNTIHQVTKELGVNRNIVIAWCDTPDVKRQLLAAAEQSVATARDQLQAGALSVSQRLLDIACGRIADASSAEVRAAEAVLDRVGMAVTQHVEMKVDDLRAKTDADLAAIVARGRPAPVREGEA